MSNFAEAFDYVMKWEGEEAKALLNDPGGMSKFGISLRFLKTIPIARLNKYGIFPKKEEPDNETIWDLTLDQAKEIYQGEFWMNAPFVDIRSQKVANYIFDMVINLGMAPAIKCVQRAIWAAAKKRNFVAEDGILGKQTIEQINRFVIFLIPPLMAERAALYRLIVLHNETEKSNLDSWLRRTYEAQ